MRRFERWSFHFESKQLRDLKELSKRTSVPQSVFVREAVNYILKKYKYLLTMKLYPEEARYLHARSRGVESGENSLSRLAFLLGQRRKKGENHFPNSKEGIG